MDKDANTYGVRTVSKMDKCTQKDSQRYLETCTVYK